MAILGINTTATAPGANETTATPGVTGTTTPGANETVSTSGVNETTAVSGVTGTPVPGVAETLILLFAAILIAAAWARLGRLEAIVWSGLGALFSLYANALITTASDSSWAYVTVALFVIAVITMFITVLALPIRHFKIPPLRDVK